MQVVKNRNNENLTDYINNTEDYLFFEVSLDSNKIGEGLPIAYWYKADFIMRYENEALFIYRFISLPDKISYFEKGKILKHKSKKLKRYLRIIKLYKMGWIK